MTRSCSGPGMVLDVDLAQRLMAHARAELPQEACALVGGDPPTGIATSVHLTRNALASPLRFEVDPRDLVETVLALDAAGVELLAVFHSHTRSPAIPSIADIRETHYRAFHLIASLSDRQRPLRAWRIDGSIATEAPLAIRERPLSPGPVGGMRPSPRG